jgi:uncharacterized membrane protein SpoIIM required for sporulation
MVSIQWAEKRQSNWNRLEELVRRAGSGLRGLDHAELQELGLLYRQIAADLATALEDRSSAQLAAYLNQLLSRAHNLIYMGKKQKAGGIAAFYRDEYPRIFRENLPQTLLAVAIFAVAMMAGWAVTIRDPAFAHRLLGTQMMETINRREMWTHSVLTVQPLAASTITTNNLTVAFATFAMGITVIGTIWMMLLNGLMLGVVGAATWHAGMAISLWSFVAPHGVLELPSIFIAGGAGFEIARGLLFPGLLPRKEALTRAGGKASRLLLGSIPLLLIAGTIEGFFSPTGVAPGLKFLLGALLGCALMAWLFGTGKREAVRSDSGLSLPDTDSRAPRTTPAH